MGTAAAGAAEAAIRPGWTSKATTTTPPTPRHTARRERGRPESALSAAKRSMQSLQRRAVGGGTHRRGRGGAGKGHLATALGAGVNDRRGRSPKRTIPSGGAGRQYSAARPTPSLARRGTNQNSLAGSASRPQPGSGAETIAQQSFSYLGRRDGGCAVRWRRLTATRTYAARSARRPPLDASGMPPARPRRSRVALGL